MPLEWRGEKTPCAKNRGSNILIKSEKVNKLIFVMPVGWPAETRLVGFVGHFGSSSTKKEEGEKV